MKKKKRFWHTLTAALLLISMLALSLMGCGSSSSTKSYEMTADEAPAAMENSSSIYTAGVYDMTEVTVEEAVEEAAPMEGAKTSEIDDSSESTSDRKLIKTVHMDVETEDYPTLIHSVSDKVESIGGYTEHYESYNENNIGNRGCSLTLRIPAAQLDSFIDQVSEISNITYRQESVEDVTLKYVDLESHKKMLLEEQERLMELLGQAETIEDIISIESRLTEVRYQLESMESQLRTIDNKVTYSTIYLSINEVTRYTPPVEKGAWERMSSGFIENVYNVIDGFKEFGIGFVISIPVIIVYAVIITAAFLIFRLIRKRIGRKKTAKNEMTGILKKQPFQNTTDNIEESNKKD